MKTIEEEIRSRPGCIAMAISWLAMTTYLATSFGFIVMAINSIDNHVARFMVVVLFLTIFLYVVSFAYGFFLNRYARYLAWRFGAAGGVNSSSADAGAGPPETSVKKLGSASPPPSRPENGGPTTEDSISP